MKIKFRKDSPAFRVAFTGIFAALTLTVSLIERLIVSALPLPPGVKPGLGNIAVMLVCFTFGLPYALAIVLIKSAFLLLVSGVSGAFISLCGGLLSVLVMFLLETILKRKTGFIGLSVAGALCHNAGQLIAASILVGSSLYLAYAPVLIVSGVVCGVITGVLMTFIEPAVTRAVNK